jgi:arylsulfatase A-like enzyme
MIERNPKMTEISRDGAADLAPNTSGKTDRPMTDGRNGSSIDPTRIGHDGVRKPDPSILATSAWLGLVIGMIEVSILLIEKYQNHVATIGALRLNRHYPWMIPLAHMALFLAFGLALELFEKTKPTIARQATSLVLGSLAILELLLTIRVLSTIACVLLGCGIASRLIPRLARYRPVFSSLVRASLVPLAVGLLLLMIGRHAQFAWGKLHGATKMTAAAGSPNVLFLVLDTVRAKSLGLYGYGRDTSPTIDRLGRSGVSFAEARSTAPWTLPSHAGMFTGRFPSELFQYHEQKLDASVPTLAGYLGRNGYATAGFVANTFYCNTGFGLASGFDHYEDFEEVSNVSPSEILRNAEAGRRLIALVGEDDDHSIERKDANRINSDFLAWLPTRGDRPFFAFLNYMDAHAPYEPPSHAERHFGLQPTTPDDLKKLAKWQYKEYIPDEARETEMARDAYDDCIASLDGALGRLFDELDRRGLTENTLIILTSDHGEEIGEHRLVGHGRSLYRDELHVPLMIVRPGRVPSGRVVAEPISLRNLPATVVDLLGLSQGSPFPGKSLAPLWTIPPDGKRPEPGLVKSEVAIRKRSDKNGSRPPAIRGPMVSVVAEGMTYIRNANGDEELYRLLDDPEEAKNLARDEALRPTLERLRALAGPMDSP